MSGGEFGVVGRVEARDPKTGKMVWSRPVVEGHMGYKDGKETASPAPPTPPGTAKPGRPAAQPATAGGTYDPQTKLALLGTGNPGPWNSHVRKGRQPVLRSPPWPSMSRVARSKWHYQSTPNDGWDYDGVNEFVTFDMDGKRMGAKADHNASSMSTMPTPANWSTPSPS